MDNNEVVYNDDPEIPAETIIYYSKSASTTTFVLMLTVVLVGIIYEIFNDKYLLAIAFIVIGFGGGIYRFLQVRKAIKKKPQIILNESGLQTASTPFQPWHNISGEQVLTKRLGSYNLTDTEYYLTYKYPGGVEKMNIMDMTTDNQQLQHLLEIYRLRSGKN